MLLEFFYLRSINTSQMFQWQGKNQTILILIIGHENFLNGFDYLE